MQYSLSILLLFLQSTSVFATGTTKSFCYTQRSPTSVKSISTASKANTIYLPVFGVVTSTPSTTITPAVTTTTSTTTFTVTTTVPQVTDTFTEITVISETDTLTFPPTTTTLTGSATVTVTVLGGTTTIATAAGFMPAIDTIPGASSNQKREVKKKDTPVLSRINRNVLSLLDSRGVGQQCPSIPKKGGSIPKSYPKTITCYKVVTVYKYIIYTKTAKTTTTITAPTPTSTLTVSTTNTQTVTSADASTTVTEIDTSTSLVSFTPTVTESTTVMTTVTVSQAASTSYAACNSDNMIGTVNGQGINGLTSGDNAAVFSNSGDSSALGCCNSCFSNPQCEAFAFYGGFPNGQQCYVGMANGQCTDPASRSASVSLSQPPLDPNTGYFVGNGNCLQINQIAS